MNGYVLSLVVGLFLLLSAVTPCASESQEPITYEQIVKNRWEMTGAQFAEYQKTLVGQQVRWSGKLSDVAVNEWLFGTSYTARINVAGYEPSVFCNVPKDVALRLEKNASYAFAGTIKEIGSFLQIAVILRDVSFE